MHERANPSCFADDQGFQAANRNVSEAVFIRTIPAGKGPEKSCVLTTRGHYIWCLCQTTGGGCWGVAGDGPEPHGHSQPAWSAGNTRGSVLWCLAPRCVVGRKPVYALCGEKSKWQQTLCVPPLGLSCFPQFRWSHLKLLPVLQTQRFCFRLLQVASPLVVPCFLFTSCEQEFRSAVPNYPLCGTETSDPSHQAV